MLHRVAVFGVCWSAVCLPFCESPAEAPACCPAPSENEIVLNADQTVLLIWDAAKKTQHFIRKANFKGKGEDFGFIVPSPTQPELSESGDAAFPYLHDLTKAEVIYKKRPPPGMGCGCAAETKMAASGSGSGMPSTRVLERKEVAGFQAVVLEADTADVLVAWLKENGFAYSPEIAAWAKPYVEKQWKFTALKIAKKKDVDQVDAAALRISFVTDAPLFPYREPDYKTAGPIYNPGGRTLRIFFVGESRYQGDLAGTDWTSASWSDRLTREQRRHLLEVLKLPETTGPAEWRLTEFVHHWPYRVAPGDVVFSPAADQAILHRPPVTVYTSRANAPLDATALMLVALAGYPLWRSRRRAATAEASGTTIA
jgi:hypothetical protein